MGQADHGVRASPRVLILASAGEFIRFRGRPRIGEKHDAKNTQTISGRVPEEAGHFGSRQSPSEELARESEPSEHAIRDWLAQAERDEGTGDEGMFSDN